MGGIVGIERNPLRADTRRGGGVSSSSGPGLGDLPIAARPRNAARNRAMEHKRCPTSGAPTRPIPRGGQRSPLAQGGWSDASDRVGEGQEGVTPIDEVNAGMLAHTSVRFSVSRQNEP